MPQPMTEVFSGTQSDFRELEEEGGAGDPLGVLRKTSLCWELGVTG